jgi:hypothetical protein
MTQIDPKALDALVKSIASKVIKETLAPMQGAESEEDRQHAMSQELQSLKKSPRKAKRHDEELDEAEDEEAKDDSDTGEEGEKKSSEFVSKKIATGKEEPKKPKAVIPDPSEIKDVTFAQVVNMMNMMRSGKSAKDPETKNRLSSYFKGLNPGERQALFVLLSGLTQILAGGVEGDEAPDPAQVGISIKPKPSDRDSVPGPKSKSAAKTPGSPASVSKPFDKGPAEALPIVVGEAADRSQILQRISRLRVKS